MLSKSFLDNYPDFPEHMNELSKFVYYRTYSRWLPEKGRRETWKETCERAVNYNCSLAPIEKGEDEDLFHNMFNLKQFISGRSLWIGGTEAVKKSPLACFNCAFVVIDNVKSFCDLFYLLMVGTGVGFRILPDDVEKLPMFRTDMKLETFHNPTKKWGDPNTTTTGLAGGVLRIDVGDSKDGWVDALEIYLNTMLDHTYKVSTILLDFSKIRPKGTPLKTFGGTASGHESVMQMFEKIHDIIKSSGNGKLRPIHCLDICNIIGQNVVVGGVRRTAEIAIIDPNDKECVDAKVNLQKHNYHRFMSNNSMYLEKKPTLKELQDIFENIKKNGEPAFINVQEAKRRREDFAGMNPCAEVILPPNAVCNLTTINLPAFIGEDGKPDWQGLKDAIWLSARSAYRMTCVELELPEWNEIHHRDRLLGCSMTGYQDFVTKVSPFATLDFLETSKWLTRKFADEYADELGLPRSLKVTAVKPEGTLSLIAGGVSAGLHYQHAPYFIRRIRVNAHDPLAKTAIELGWQIHPEVGQTMENANTLVIDFPCKAIGTVTKNDVSAVDQLDTYLKFQKDYTEMNTSNTITVKDHEWDDVIVSVYNNWDNILAVSFLAHSGENYPLMPYEECTKEEYEELKAKMKPFDERILNKYEIETQNMGKEFEILDDREGCENGVCPIR